ncbi:MAG: helix-turn-helix domain-containing protein [Acidimicrobiia bacterium]
MGDITVRTVHDLSAALRGRRKDLGLSQVEVANRVGASRKWVSDFETGRAVADTSMLLRLVDVLGFSLRLRSEPPDRDHATPADLTDLDALLADYLRS